MPSATPAKRTKKAKEAAVTAVAAAATEEPVSAAQPEQQPEQSSKKKAKKPVKVVAVVTPNGIEGSFTPEPRRPLIAHLTVHSTDPLFSDSTVAPATGEEPEPYNPATTDVFAGDQEAIQQPVDFKQDMRHPSDETTLTFESATAATATSGGEIRSLQCFAKAGLMVQFAESSKAQALPEKTKVACFWCAHGFDTQPCIIPEREVNSVYIVYGNFCCPECAFAYLLQETMDPHVRWERIALLHRIYDREGKGRMFPAPGREVLQLFGGPLTIESFRATVRAGKVRIDIHMPPMVSILGSIDTKPIDFFDSSLKNTVSGALQQEKVSKAEEGLRLKRTKPLKDKESTLDSVMNIQIRSARPKN